MYQAIGGCLFHLIITLLFVDPYINFSKTFIIAMSHQIFLVSFGAFTILMYLIKNNSASKTVTVFFLIPATSAAMAWLFLNEALSSYDIVGFLIASLGVYIATRETSGRSSPSLRRFIPTTTSYVPNLRSLNISILSIVSISECR